SLRDGLPIAGYANRSLGGDGSLRVAGSQSLPLATVGAKPRSLASPGWQGRAEIADVDLARTRRVIVIMQARSRRRSARFDSYMGAEVGRTIRVDFDRHTKRPRPPKFR